MGEEKKRAVQFQLQSYTRESHCLMNPPVSSTHQVVNSVLGATHLGKQKKNHYPVENFYELQEQRYAHTVHLMEVGN